MLLRISTLPLILVSFLGGGCDQAVTSDYTDHIGAFMGDAASANVFTDGSLIWGEGDAGIATLDAGATMGTPATDASVGLVPDGGLDAGADPNFAPCQESDCGAAPVGMTLCFDGSSAHATCDLWNDGSCRWQLVCGP